MSHQNKYKNQDQNQTANKMRPLIPFFNSSPDGTLSINDPHHPATSPPTAPSPRSPPLIPLPVRIWDPIDGVFKNNIHLVQDHLPPPAPTPTPPSAPPRLLTPAEIRAKRRLSRRTPSAPPAAPPAPAVATPATPRPPVPDLHTPPPLLTHKPHVFAGSTFEAASPPPTRLPIPAFARRTAGLKHPDVAVSQANRPFDRGDADADTMEKAALDLRRMLRI